VPLDQPIQDCTALKIKELVDELYLCNYISDKQRAFLLPPPEPRPRRFYLLPKIHKPISSWLDQFTPPGRPIVSNVSSETSNISKFLDSFLVPLANKHPSYIKNSYEFVKKIRHMEVGVKDFLVTADISSLYTNMDNTLTIEAVKKQFLKFPDPKRPDFLLLKILETLLTSNDFVFDDKSFKQIRGCSMGLSCSPSLANIFLIEFDRAAIQDFHIKPKIFFRFLDDIFFMFRGSILELYDYQNFLNTLIPGITLTFHHDSHTVDFLDISIFKFLSRNIYKLFFFSNPLMLTNFYTMIHFTPPIFLVQLFIPNFLGSKEFHLLNVTSI